MTEYRKDSPTSVCPDCGERYPSGFMWAQLGHDQNHCKPKREKRAEAEKQRERRQRALDRIIAREMKAVEAEEKLADGLARGHYECEKCGEPRGWTMKS